MKYIKFILLSSFLILFLGFCDIVSALSMYTGTFGTNQISGFDRNYNGYYVKDNLSLKSNWSVQYNLTNVNVSNYDYFYFHLFFNYYDILSTSNTNNDYRPPDNSQYYCSSWSLRNQTYADGTTSQYYVCEEWKNDTDLGQFYTTHSNGSISLNNKISVAVDVLLDNSYWSVCSFDIASNGISTVNCPLNHNRTSISAIRVRYTNINWNENNISASVGISNNYNLIRDPTRELINSQNNNTQSIIDNQNKNQQETNNKLNDMNDNITSTDVTGANSSQSNIVNNPAFKDNTGLSGVITAPLTMISSLTNQCQPIQLTLPYLKNTNVIIPCMGDFLQQKIPTLITLIKLVVNGFICYLIGLDLFKIVKNARNPDDDRIEVLDL